MAAPRRRHNISRTGQLVAAVSVLLLGAVAWYFTADSKHAEAATSDDNTTSSSTSRRRRPPPSPSSSPLPSLTLVCSTLPPTPILLQLSSHYTLHLLLPSPSGSPIPIPLADDFTAQTGVEIKRIIPHQTGEGVVHVLRVLGGLVVLARGCLSAKEDQEQGRQVEGGQLTTQKVVKEVRSFVRGILVVRGLGLGLGSEGEGELTGEEEGKAVQVVQGWRGVLDKLLSV